jgi:hypothetical protein
MRKRFIGLAAVYMLIPAMLLGQPAGKKELVGVWAAKEAPVEQSQSPLLSLAMFGGEGSFTNGRWIQGASTCSRGSGLGDRDRPRVWPMGRHGGKEFQLTYYSVLWKEGLVNGFQRVQGTLALTESGDEYTGRAQR